MDILSKIIMCLATAPIHHEIIIEDEAYPISRLEVNGFTVYVFPSHVEQRMEDLRRHHEIRTEIFEFNGSTTLVVHVLE